jgi:hypothetical protein
MGSGWSIRPKEALLETRLSHAIHSKLCREIWLGSESMHGSVYEDVLKPFATRRPGHHTAVMIVAEELFTTLLRTVCTLLLLIHPAVHACLAHKHRHFTQSQRVASNMISSVLVRFLKQQVATPHR